MHIASLTAAQRLQGVRVTEVYNSGQPAGESLRLWPRARLDKIRPTALRELMFYGAAAMRRIDLSDGRIPVVHAHGDWPAFLFAHWLGKRLNAGAVAASIHEWMQAPDARYRFALRRSDPIFATGLQEARRLTALLGRNVIHLPSAPAELFFSSASKPAPPADVVATGSLIPRKNIEAILGCAERRPSLAFAIYGDGPDRARLEQLAKTKRLNNVEFRGAADADGINAGLRSARLFVNSAYREGSPTAALEAMACGLPVVLTPSNDYSALVEQGVSGLVTAGFGPDELVGAIDEFLEHDGRRQRAGAAARRAAERHRWAHKAEIVTSAMLAAVTGKTGPR